MTNTGMYGTAYLHRALITAIGLGANRPQDAVYPTTEAAATGTYTGGTSTSCTSQKDRCLR